MLLALLLGCPPAAVPKTGGDDSPDPRDTSNPSDTGPVDLDGDGFSVADGDCDDADANAYPGAPETWYDGVDEACDGGSDDDQDGDGVDVGDDCDDTDARVYPGAPDEPYDGIDTDCVADEDDRDGDGWDGPVEDCDDTDPNVNPGATERCDGTTDEDCDGLVDEEEEALGDGEACPADDCLTIHTTRPDAPDGVYWIEVGGATHDVVCDMTEDNGGWTLVANFVWPGNTNGVAGWTSGSAVGSSTSDRTQSFKLSDTDINSLVRFRYRGHGTASTCTQDDRSVSACTVDTTLYWDSACVYASGTASSGACTAAYQTYDLDGWTELSNPCSWHYGLTSADCGVTSEFGTSHEGDHVFAGIVGTYIHAYDGRPNEDPNVEVWVR